MTARLGHAELQQEEEQAGKQKTRGQRRETDGEGGKGTVRAARERWFRAYRSLSVT